VDDSLTWRAPDGRPLLPYHPYTKESVVAVPAGRVTRYDIEVFPTVARIAAGHRLRLTLTTSDTPHLLPSRTQAADLSGGLYDIQRNRSSASFVELPLVRSAEFKSPAGAVAAACAAHRRVTVRVVRHGRIARAHVRVDGHAVRAMRRGRRSVRIDLRGRSHGVYRVVIVARLAGGRRVRVTRAYRACHTA
jgi:hypothetical protein